LQANHFYVLQVRNNASALLPFAYLIIGGALAATIKPFAKGRQLGFISTVAVIALLPWVLASYGHIFPTIYLFNGPLLEIGWIVAGSIVLLSPKVLLPAMRRQWRHVRRIDVGPHDGANYQADYQGEQQHVSLTFPRKEAPR
jgi:hypothetical protein